MIVLSLVVVGSASYFKLGVDRFPSVDLPTVSVRTNLPGASPEEMETLVSQRIEEVVNTVDGIDNLRSVSVQGNSIVLATFNLNRDIDTAAQDVRDRVSTVVRDLPPDAKPPVVAKFNNDSTPVVTIALSGQRSIRELTEYADKVVRVQLERAGGVGEVNVSGGLDRAINVWIDAERLAAYKIPITQVHDALQRQNADVPGGNVETGKRELVLRTLGRYTDPREMEDLVVANINGSPVKIRDIGRVEDGTKEQRSIARLNGVPTVTLEVRRQSGANTVEVIHNVKAQLARVAAQLPADVKMEVIRDQERYIGAALHEITRHLVLGSILASLVVLLFMRSWRSTLIAAIAIPCSVISTFGMMRALNFTLNGVTMLALVLMVGVVIDDAIVVLENIFRFVEEKRITPMRAAKEATADIGLAVMATTFSLVVIFLPVSFMSSISGRFLFQFGITAAVAVLVSLLVSFTLTPMMSARLLRAKDAAAGHASEHGHHHDTLSAASSRRGFYSFIDRFYTWLLRLAMRHRMVVAVIAIAVALSSIPLYRVVKQEYIPTDVDEAEFDVNVNAPEGTNIDAMNDAMLAIEKDLLRTPGVRLILSSSGGSFLGAVNQGGVYVRIAPHDERVFSLTKLWDSIKSGHPLAAFRGNYTQRDVMQEVRRRMQKYAPLRFSVRNAPSFNIGGGNNDIDFVFRGPELQQLAKYADALREKTKEIGGIVDADTTLKLDKPELRVHINRDRARRSGSRHLGHFDRAALDGWRRRSGLAFPRSFGERRLRRSAAADRTGSQRQRDYLASLCAVIARRTGAPGQSGGYQGRPQPFAHRSTRSPKAGFGARRRGARICAGRSAGRSAQGRGGDEFAGGLFDHRRRPRPRTGKNFRRVSLGVSALDHFHVHDSGFAVREHDSPAHYSPEPAAFDSVCFAFVMVVERHAESLFGAGHPGAVRRGQEERDPANRSHEQSAHAGHGARSGHHPGQSRSSAANSDDDAGAGCRHGAAGPGHRSGSGRASLDRHRGHRRTIFVAAADAGRHAGRVFAAR